ncbi:MAG: hypothetical protein HOK80_08665 [Candidatus Cloacimonetes bacterium]|jgi:hypothetical protein|nr:hypothetical protein [Candidatus Cloacimonadota bacterium]MBT4332150.1 hypothetical protein [Candidatus Cloacimonadota bacterium]MBT4575273.1 hypothetical protein [Candidatus Cloacimonadota bacterium]MBT5420952.1 hypothetical protein [Candidatus Cloacimonadota bacterium]
MKKLIYIYSIGGVIAIFSSAIYRLYPHVKESMSLEFSALNWTVLAAYLIVMIVGKGYFALHRGFVPRVIVRSEQIISNGNLIDKLLAPLYCMGFFKAPKKRMIISYLMILFIISFLVSASKIVQPWRGIIDLGVIVGLSLGIISLLLLGSKKLISK